MTTTTRTQSVCLAIPLLAGAADADREAMASCWTGDRRDAHAASRRAHGITRESVWIQDTPAGEVAIVLLESEDLAAALRGVATSEAPFDAWFRAHVATVHGVDLAAGVPRPEQVLDFRG
jgi:hypothetical protein